VHFVLAATSDTPSGIQISMPFLFQIIAGLLLADLFKQAVEVLNKSRAAANIFLLCAALRRNRWRRGPGGATNEPNQTQ
jgi:hypothetical protein